MKKLKRIILWILFPASMMMAMAYDEYEHDRVMDEDFCVHNVEEYYYDAGTCRQLNKGEKHHFHMFFGVMPLVWHYNVDGIGCYQPSYEEAKCKSHEE